MPSVLQPIRHLPLSTCGEWPFKCGEWLCLQIFQIHYVLSKNKVLETPLIFFNLKPQKICTYKSWHRMYLLTCSWILNFVREVIAGMLRVFALSLKMWRIHLPQMQLKYFDKLIYIYYNFFSSINLLIYFPLILLVW